MRHKAFISFPGYFVKKKREKVKYLLDFAELYSLLPKAQNCAVSVDALKPLIREKDPVVKDKVIEKIRNDLIGKQTEGRGSSGRGHKKKLTTGNIMQIIHQVKAEGPLLKKYHYFLGNKKEKKRGQCCFRAWLMKVVVEKGSQVSRQHGQVGSPEICQATRYSPSLQVVSLQR